MGIAGDGDTLAPIFTGEFADPGGNLPPPQLGLAQPLGPIGRERAMGRSGRGILGDAGMGRE